MSPDDPAPQDPNPYKSSAPDESPAPADLPFESSSDTAAGAFGRAPRISEDWLAVLFGGAILAVVLLITFGMGTVEPSKGNFKLVSPLKSWITAPGEWDANPLDSLRAHQRPLTSEVNTESGEAEVERIPARWPGVLGGVLVIAIVGLGGAWGLGRAVPGFAAGLVFTLLLATVAYVLSGQETVKYYNLEYALWALLAGLVVSNTLGTPAWMRPALMTEFYIKTGLVLLGAELLFGQLLALGLPGICVAWVVTPIVLVSTFWFGQRVLKIQSPTLNMVISADMSVCGVSAAIATAAACRAKKEELSLAIGMSLSFTVVMMVVMPAIINAAGMSQVLGGAWMGGTIDSTGAVAAAGGILGDTALKVASTVKMIQNILIGVIAFGVAAYWVRFQESDPASTAPRAGISEIWNRFPRFILGFIGASIVFSIIAANSSLETGAAAATTGVTKNIRGWLFCMAFVCIGLETNFAHLARFMQGGKPLILYLVGQSLNLVLTLLMAWLAFVKWFPQITEAVEQASP